MRLGSRPSFPFPEIFSARKSKRPLTVEKAIIRIIPSLGRSSEGCSEGGPFRPSVNALLSVSRGPRISGLPDSRICYGLPSCSPPLYGSDRYTRPTRAFTSRLPAGRSPSPLLDMTTTATGLLCWRDSHPLEWQLASLHQIVPWSTLCRADWVRDVQSLPRAAGYYATTTQFLRELREAMRQRANIQGVSLMGLGKRGRLRVDQPTITG